MWYEIQDDDRAERNRERERQRERKKDLESVAGHFSIQLRQKSRLFVILPERRIKDTKN